MTALETTKKYLRDCNPKWNGKMLDIRAAIFMLPTGGDTFIDAQHQHIYQAAEDVGAKISIQFVRYENDKGPKARLVTKKSQDTDTMEDAVMACLSEESLIPEDNLLALTYKIVNKIKEHYDNQ